MRWRILCFAGLREQLKTPEIEIDLPEGATVSFLLAALEDSYSQLRGRLGSVRVAADYEFLNESDPLPQGSELALIPPVSGGSTGSQPMDLVELTMTPLDARRAHAAVSGPDAGAVATFMGTVRADSRGKRVLRLEYEAYAPMAEDRIQRIAREARERFNALRLAVLHRTGRLEVGEISVIIAASAAHRAEAFAACRHVIEALKAQVPIWKKEFYADGETWVGWGS